MNNLKLKNKIFVVLILPLFTILILSFMSIWDKYKNSEKMDNSLEYLYFLEKVSSLIHDLQKERNISTLFLESYGKEFSEELKTQINKSDESINKLNEFLKNYSFFKDEEAKKRVSNFGKNIKQIQETRQKNIDLQISKQDLEKNYTFEIDNCCIADSKLS